MLILLFTLTISLMILLPVVFAALLRRRFETPWLLFAVGMLTFAGSQAVHLPLNNWLGKLGILTNPAQSSGATLIQIAIVGGLTAGLCEELSRAVGYALLRKVRGLPDGIMLGLGHGGLEAMVFGGVLTASTVSMLLPLAHSDLSLLKITPEQIQAVQTQIDALLASPLQAFLPLVERLLAMGIHVTFSLMVLRAFQKHNPAWVVLAIGYHALIDAAAIFFGHSMQNAWLFEGEFFLISLPGFIWLAWNVRQALRELPARAVSPMRREWYVFMLGMRKELLQAWRTRRFLVVMAVFALFGLSSPLLAYFTPQMLKAIPGAEQFAALIPPPTAGDAMVQYIKYISQFGFILVILLGMGAVAGEKEGGTASLILSKPMTRWTFVLTKLISQLLLYALGFVIAFLGCYLYTIVLFGSLNPGPFAVLNLAMLLWLLPFTAITLLGSVIGKSTGAAAGISLLGVVILLLAGSIPQIAQLLPGALLGWASQLGTAAAGIAPSTPGAAPSATQTFAAGGAMASAVVLAIIFLVVSFGIFEQQELD